MRKLLLAFVAVLWIVAGIQLVQNLNPEDEGQIVQAFNKTNCMNAMSKIQVNGLLNTGYKTMGQQREILIRIAETLGITGGYNITEEKDGAQTTIELSREAAQAETRMRIISVESEDVDNVVETIQYLIVEIQLYDKLECAVPYKKNLQEAVAEYGITDDVSLEFSGELPGKITVDEQKELVKQLLKSISARMRKEYKGKDLYTVYAYTELVEESREINGQSVNVTVAVNYDEEKQQTGLYLATPFIKEDY